jgi:aspartyl-tRNA synthetase
MFRTHTCGDLNKSHVGSKDVKLCGWVQNRRDHGGVSFIDIRDRFGLTQIVFVKGVDKEMFAEAKKLRMEDCVCITGEVNARQEKSVNPNMATGEIEVLAKGLQVYSRSADLPFMIEPNIDVAEDTRLKHRYLDLRRPDMKDNIVLRHKAAMAARNFLSENGFLEIETPTLNKSTPEGARDFLVPSRMNPGEFYALPQSPQLFKQMLMVSGMDRYFQVARCYRDEDLRKDRQPEFTQIDMEISFGGQEDLITIIEGMMKRMFKDTLGIELNTPFPRMTHKEAAEKYQSDKPNLPGDEPFRFLWVVDFPMFKYDKESNSWAAEHHPFTMPKAEDMDKIDTDPASMSSYAFDLVMNGNELGSGSVRIHDAEIQKKVFSRINLTEEEAKVKFDFLLRAFEYGPPPHAGFAVGLDRIVMLMRNAQSIRDVIAFPKNQKGQCLMSSAPSPVSPSQLDELCVRINVPTDK